MDRLSNIDARVEGSSPEQLAEFFFRAFSQLEKNTMEQIYSDYIANLSRKNGDFSEFLSCLKYMLINCSSNLLFFDADTCEDYCVLTEYIDKIFPSLKFKTHQCYQFLHLAKEGADGLRMLEHYMAQVEKQIYWTEIEKIPQFIEFDYVYPNGKQGDILKYIFEEYGENTEKDSLIWHGKIERGNIALFDVLYPVSESCGYKVKVLSEDPKFKKVFEHHIPTIIDDKLTELVYKKANYFQKFREIQARIHEYRKTQTHKRNEIYSQLVLQGKTSPKWKSEAQLYALVSNIYPDTIYQYRADWLHMQSLDIYIPSLQIGIEYQGRQHYEPIKYFGGEEHFKKQQENDRKKKLLCNENDVKLIEWPYTETITEDTLRKLIAEITI